MGWNKLQVLAGSSKETYHLVANMSLTNTTIWAGTSYEFNAGSF